MVKKLQKKFVKTSMTAVTALLLVFIVAVNVATAFNSFSQARQKFDAIHRVTRIRNSMNYQQDSFIEPGGFQEEPAPPSIPSDENKAPPEESEELSEEDDFSEKDGESDETQENGRQYGLPKQPRMFGISEDDAFSARYFSVMLSSSGKTTGTDVTHISSVTGSQASEYAAAVKEKGKSEVFTATFYTELNRTGRAAETS